MSKRPPEEPVLPRYQPVSDTGNGHRVRPDFQTKAIGAFVLCVFLGSIGWVGSKVTDLSDRMTKIETLVEVKLDEVLRRLTKLEENK